MTYKFPGRPRIWDPISLAVKLDEWSKKEDSQWLGDFLIEIEAPCHTYLARWSNESEDFATTLRLAKWRIASRNRKALHRDEYNSVLFQREIGMYDSLMKEHDREKAEFESSLKQKEDGAKPTHVTVKVMNGLGAGANISTETVST